MLGIKNIKICLLGMCLLFSGLPALYAQQGGQEADCSGKPDSAFVFKYRPRTRVFETKYENNARLLRELSTSLKSFHKGTDTLYVQGYSGAYGRENADLGTAFWRCINLKGFLINTEGVRECDFKTKNYPYAHNTLGEVVLLSFMPREEGFMKSGEVSEGIETVNREEEKQGTDRLGEPANEMASEQDSQQNTTVEDRLPASDSPIEKTNSIRTEVPIADNAGCDMQGKRYVALKTNLAAWVGTILNVAADVQVGKHFSVELPVLWCPWYVSDRHAVRTFTIQPEARYWLAAPGKGHFFGLHAHVGWFNVKWNDTRYQDTNRPLLGAGISYGYLLPLSAHWGAEFTLGAGYANLKYDTYYNIADGARFDTRTKGYWGITRVGISVVYRFNTARP